MDRACFLFESGANFPREKENPLVTNSGRPEHSDVTTRIKSHVFLELLVGVPLRAVSPPYRGLRKRASHIKILSKENFRNNDNFR